jgi:hypothetical protein
MLIRAIMLGRLPPAAGEADDVRRSSPPTAEEARLLGLPPAPSPIEDSEPSPRSRGAPAPELTDRRARALMRLRGGDAERGIAASLARASFSTSVRARSGTTTSCSVPDASLIRDEAPTREHSRCPLSASKSSPGCRPAAAARPPASTDSTLTLA